MIDVDQDIAKVLNYTSEKGASFVSISISRESAACYKSVAVKGAWSQSLFAPVKKAWPLWLCGAMGLYTFKTLYISGKQNVILFEYSS